MPIEYRQPTAEDVSELGRICYEAFKDIAERHGFEPDFTDLDMGRMIIGMLVAGEDTYGIAAYNDGQPAGSNFVMMADDVGGIGPITVDVPQQGAGIGRRLMTDAIDYAKKNGMDKIRLLEDSFNMASLSLYASVGFDTKAPCVLMEPVPAPQKDPTVRVLTEDDLAAVDALSRELYKVSRRNEVAEMLEGPFAAVIRERDNRVTGYYLLGIIGHGVAETEEDALSLVQQAAAADAPPQFRDVFCPLTEGSLYRKFLAAGFRAKKVMNLMAIGPYEEPEGVWMPSVVY
ncbi:MAG: GNAT family N-acetyltransferase [Chloroflexi bacterium]|nr:GNAT family N-acetyltransferase [Chloroflexota bacterium]